MGGSKREKVGVLEGMVETEEAAGQSSLSMPVRVEFQCPKQPTKNIGARIRVKREELRLSQAELAERVGVITQTVKGWESGSQSPRVGNRVRLAEVLGDGD